MNRRAAGPGNHVQRALRQVARVWWAAAMPVDTLDSPRRVFATYAEAFAAYGDDCEFEIWHVRRERLPHLIARHNARVRAHEDRWARRQRLDQAARGETVVTPGGL